MIKNDPKIIKNSSWRPNPTWNFSNGTENFFVEIENFAVETDNLLVKIKKIADIQTSDLP